METRCQRRHSTSPGWFAGPEAGGGQIWRTVSVMAGQMWRAVAVFRVVTLVYAAFLIISDHDRYAHPSAGLLALGVMSAWTAITVLAYARPGGRGTWLICTDVAVAAMLVLSTRLIDTASRIDAGAPTIPVAWAASPILACAVAGGPVGGLAGAAVIVAADIAERGGLPQSTFNNAVLLLIAGGVGGYVVRLGLRAEATVDSAARREAAIAERERIARGIHDSVLQVLALVSVKGRELGGEAAELAKLAAEQENALRSLVSGASVGHTRAGLIDLAALLEPLGDSRVTVSCPAGSVILPDAAAHALAAAVGEALDNVRRHAGADARAWVLVEDDGLAVTVSVRDDGTGFAAGRLAEAEEAGRLGVAHSIVGRLAGVAGSARLTSAPGQGTEVELRVPRG
jgi:signal transduction histidine kinase